MGALQTFPVSYKVDGRRIVVVGGGAEALNKARLAAMTTAELLIVGRRLEADFSALAATLAERPFTGADLDGAALCFVADHGPDGIAAQAAARARGVPLNVVDMPGQCDFYTPSIIDRAPLTVAIASDGSAPVLARLVRARIEAVLSPGLGGLAALAGAMRARVAAMLSGRAARHYYEAMLTSPAVEQALARGEGPAAAEALLEAQAHGPRQTGMVWLVGAGPGAIDLLTLRAQRVLQEADVILHDVLVPEAVVAMGRRDAERIAVGSPERHGTLSPVQVVAMLVRLAQQGKRVVRLESGAPLASGRANADLAALRQAGIAHEIVPGVPTAAAGWDGASPLAAKPSQVA